MKIYLVRHGIAEERGGAKPDDDRALTGKGKRRTRKAMRGFAKLREVPRLVLSSPLVRAWETAVILARVSGADAPRVETALAPGGDLDAVLARLRREGRESVALVGHEPDLSTLAERLGASNVLLRKGAVARRDGDPEPRQARLAWLLQRYLLRHMAR
ncbi:MAG: phosphohistidine phosphatase SixA [Planctomycetota bacterium]